MGAKFKREGNYLVQESPTMNLRTIHRADRLVVQQQFMVTFFEKLEGVVAFADKPNEFRWRDIPYAGREEKLLPQDATYKEETL